MEESLDSLGTLGPLMMLTPKKVGSVPFVVPQDRPDKPVPCLLGPPKPPRQASIYQPPLHSPRLSPTRALKCRIPSGSLELDRVPLLSENWSWKEDFSSLPLLNPYRPCPVIPQHGTLWLFLAGPFRPRLSPRFPLDISLKDVISLMRALESVDPGVNMTAGAKNYSDSA